VSHPFPCKYCIDNEELQDLLSNADKKLKLEDTGNGILCQNLREVAVLNATDIFEILRKGIQRRQTTASLQNKASSRSHTIFTLKIKMVTTNAAGDEVIKHGQLNLVDLAGLVLVTDCQSTRRDMPAVSALFILSALFAFLYPLLIQIETFVWI
jgi:hypothetical protein